MSLAEVSPEDALDFCHLVGDIECRIIVCGGDGTVGWVLAAIDKANLKVIGKTTSTRSFYVNLYIYIYM